MLQRALNPTFSLWYIFCDVDRAPHRGVSIALCSSSHPKGCMSGHH
jgi:hypothetical protein